MSWLMLLQRCCYANDCFTNLLKQETVAWAREIVASAPKFLEDYRTGVQFLNLLKEAIGEDAMENGL